MEVPASGSVRSRDIALTTTAVAVTFVDDSQPADQSLVQGEALTMSIEVEGSPNFSYQWYKDDVAIDLATEPTFSIETARSLSNFTNLRKMLGIGHERPLR